MGNVKAGIEARITGDNTHLKRSLDESHQHATSWAHKMNHLRGHIFEGTEKLEQVGGGGLMGMLAGGQLIGKLGAAGAAIGLVAAAGYGLKKALEFGDTLREMGEALEGVGHDSETVESQLENLLKLSANKGVKFDLAVQASKDLRALKYTAAESRAAILAVGNALALTGNKNEDLLPAIELLAKMETMGALTTKQFNAMVAPFPKLRDAFRELGVTSGQELEKLGKDAKSITASVVGQLQKLPRAEPSATDRIRFAEEQNKYGGQELAKWLADKANEHAPKTPFEKTGELAFDVASKTKLSHAPIDKDAPARREKEAIEILKREAELRAEISNAEARGTHAESAERDLAVEQKIASVVTTLGLDKVEDAAKARKIAEEIVDIELKGHEQQRAHEREKKASARQELEDEIRVADLRRHGHTRRADQLEKEMKIRAETRRHVEEGMSETDAADLAKRHIEAGMPKDHHTRTYSAEESERRQFARNKSLREKFGTFEQYKYLEGHEGRHHSMGVTRSAADGFRGLDAHAALQRSAHADHAAAIQRQRATSHGTPVTEQRHKVIEKAQDKTMSFEEKLLGLSQRIVTATEATARHVGVRNLNDKTDNP